MKTFIRLLNFSKPYHHYIPEYVIYVLLYVFFGLLNFTLLIPLLDVLFNNTAPKIVNAPIFNLSISYLKDYFYYHLNTYVNIYGKIGVLVYVCTVLFGFVLLKNIFGFLSQKVLTRMRTTLLSKIRHELFLQLSNQSLSFFHNEKKGDLLSIVSNDVVEIETSVVTSIQTIFREPLVIIATFIMLFYLSPKLTLFTLIVFPISGFIISYISGKLRKKASKSQNLVGQLLSILEETISGIRIIKSFNAETFINKKFQDKNREFNRLTKSIVNQRELASPISEIMGVMVIVIIIVYGGSLIIDGNSNLTASSFIAYIALYFQIIAPAKNTANAFTYLQRGLSAGERVLRIIDAPQTIIQNANALTKKSFENCIRFNNISFAYKEEAVLHNLNINIQKGKIIALVGESGSGKSTFADLIPRFYDVTHGNIYIDEIDIKNLVIKDLRSLIAIVSQEAILFNDTVINNITFGSEKPDKEAAVHAAKIANAHNFITELENGYDTEIGDRGMRLSGGQKQRLTIARAIYKNAPILILDEATSALDTESERLVQDAINKMMENRTSIVIAHRLSTIRHADEIIVLQKGNIVERGNHETLIAQSGIYKRLIDMQEIK
ncbi:MAG: ABC transporter transmembrane domain-containing protein [Flavobacterium sp.]|nr:ABC transporter transmembrane domain-containing protein [Flavobacterium sp.]